MCCVAAVLKEMDEDRSTGKRCSSPYGAVIGGLDGTRDCYTTLENIWNVIQSAGPATFVLKKGNFSGPKNIRYNFRTKKNFSSKISKHHK